MHLHKINSTSQEYQNFLAQNRKDPITGDSISEGDEVVFCASCKSVFLKDTWEYLGNRHCEQSETLIEFPLYKSVHLKSQPKILFHSILPYTNGWIDSIPNLNKSTWKHKGRKLSSYDDLPYILILIGFAIAGYFCVITQSFLPAIISILFTFMVLGSRHWHNTTESNKIQTFHKNFTSNTFYITDRTVGFSSEFGMEEWFLEVAMINSISFEFKKVVAINGTFYFYKCCIKDKTGEEAKFGIRNYLKPETAKSFLNSLHYLSENFDIDVEIETNSTEGHISLRDTIPHKSKIKVSFI
jgi:hypothetical protein